MTGEMIVQAIYFTGFFLNIGEPFVFEVYSQEKIHDFSEKTIHRIDPDHQFANFGFHSDEWW